MRVAFIDFDGVLHPAKGRAGGVLPFEWVPTLAGLLHDFPDVAVVVHSSWREQFSVDYIQDFLEPLGPQFFGVTPPGPKAHSILQFLDEHPEVSSVAILDDEVDEMPRIPGALLIVCDPLLGLSCSDAQAQLVSWLNDSSYRPAATEVDAAPRGVERHASEDDDGAGLLALAVETFDRKSDAIRWMHTPHELLQGETPQQHAATLAGAERVRNMLVQLRFGGVV